MKTRQSVYLVGGSFAIALFLLWQVVDAYVSDWLFALLTWLSDLGIFSENLIELTVSLFPWFAFLVLMFEALAKLLMLQAIPDQAGYEPVQLESIPEIAQTALRNYTKALEALGFTQLLDSRDTNFPNSFSRIFCHREHGCFATVGQVVQQLPNQLVENVPMFCAIVSLLDQGWTLGINNDPPDAVTATGYAFMRLPRGVATKMPGATPAQMLQSHLELRQKMIHDLNIDVIPDLSIAMFFECSQRNTQQIKQALWRKSILFGMVERWLYSLSPKLEWLGDYADLAARRPL